MGSATGDSKRSLGVRADRLGFKGRAIMLWRGCVGCGAMRWVPAVRPRLRCRSCSGKRTIVHALALCPRSRPGQSERQRGPRNPAWKGGVTVGGNGYRYVLLDSSDPMFSMANKERRVMEHRLIVARNIGRPLEAWEQVHHKNGTRTDNRLDNLELWKRPQPSGIRQADYHCPGCTCQNKERTQA